MTPRKNNGKSVKYCQKIAFLSIALLQLTQQCGSEECTSGDILVVKDKRVSPIVTPESLSAPKWPYGWEFFGLTKAELEKKAETMQFFQLNKERTKLYAGASSAAASFDFQYRNGQISEVKKYRWDALSGQSNSVMESRSQALSLAIAEESTRIAQGQKLLDKFLAGDYLPNPFGSSKGQLVDMYFGEVQGPYLRRAFLYEQNGQHELSKADCLTANQIDIDKQKASRALTSSFR